MMIDKRAGMMSGWSWLSNLIFYFFAATFLNVSLPPSILRGYRRPQFPDHVAQGTGYKTTGPTRDSRRRFFLDGGPPGEENVLRLSTSTTPLDEQGVGSPSCLSPLSNPCFLFSAYEDTLARRHPRALVASNPTKHTTHRQ